MFVSWDLPTRLADHPALHTKGASRRRGPGARSRRQIIAAGGGEDDIHTPRTSRNPAPLFQALKLSLPRILRLALHEIIVEVPAPGPDEERRGEKRRGARADLFDLRDGVRQRGRVEEDLLVEPTMESAIAF